MASAQANTSGLLAAWRTERSQPLPVDAQVLERERAERPDDWLIRLAVARGLERAGALEEARAEVESLPDDLAVGLRVSALNLRGITRLAVGDVKAAVQAFEEARAASESAAVLFNLSQAYGRGLRLGDQSSLYNEARAVDADLVSAHTSAEGSNLHTYLAYRPVRVSEYLARALAPTYRSRALADEIRARLMGASVPEWGWMVVVALGIVGAFARRSSIQRCSRCERPMCSRCSPDGVALGTCVRCERLFVDRSKVDPRIARASSNGIDAVSADALWVWPAQRSRCRAARRCGRGRLRRGALVTFLLGAALALAFVAREVAAPGDVGRLGGVLPLVLCALAGTPVAAFALIGALRRFSLARSIR